MIQAKSVRRNTKCEGGLPALNELRLASRRHAAARLEDHNSGSCRFTAAGRPWELRVAIEFADEEAAVAFEKYLKTGSGRAFSKRHFR